MISRALIVLGSCLTMFALAWGIWEFKTGAGSGRRLDLVTNTVGFEGSARLPAEQIEAALSEAKARIESRVECSDWYARFAARAEWISFCLTGLITVIGGLLGLSTSPSESPSVEAVSARSARLGRIVAVLAALAAILTGAGGRAQSTANALFESAEKMRSVVLTVRKDVVDASTEADARVILAQLDGVRGGCETR